MAALTALVVGALAGVPTPSSATAATALPAPATTSSAARSAATPARVITDVAYADPVPETTQGNLLDLYLPERRAGETVPLFIFSEGSAWRADTGKSSAGTWAARLNPLGYAVAGVSVRSSSQVVFPGQLHDIKAAVRFLRFHAGDYGLAPDRFALGGFSSGGWAAALAGVTNDVGADLEGTEGVTGVSSRVQAVVTFAAPTALRLMDDQATAYSEGAHSTPDSAESALTGCTQYADGVGDPACANADRANPLSYVTADDPPFLMFHTSQDQTVPWGQSQVLFDALAGACVNADYHYVEGPQHLYDPYLANSGQPPVSGQTVQRVEPAGGDGSGCTVRTTHVLTEQNTPSYALVAAFLDRTLGTVRPPDATTPPRLRTTTRLRAEPSRQVYRAAARARLTASVSRRRLTAGERVRFVEGRRVLGAATLRDNGTASIRLPRRTAVGVHRVRAVFRGTDKTRASHSAPVRVRVVPRSRARSRARS